ncbi:oxidoreductase [Ferrimonas sp. YFM]|uniref:oxidoreductase n=1 Tax=Ferrimonas sp. YFM TaxID=3028878 RepID=UPI002573469C|nr:oxidoreductase [Ferrimonas sp. YFM]BDY04639.1 short-chain dehydrogenase/reductase [Ferrimonas sp. YFM]
MKSTPVAIVTGASSGIGKATVRSLIQQGYRVYCGARRVEQMADLAEDGGKVHYLDLTDAHSIDAFVAHILDKETRIDLLVNNAGYGAYGAVEDMPMEEARKQFEVNLFGLAAITNAVLPTMRQRRQGRIVHVGSMGGKFWSILGGWYQATKFALEGFADCSRNELRPFGIDVVLIQPGAIRTEWSSIAIDSIRQTSGQGPYRPIAEAAANFFENNKSMECDPQLVADVIVKAATVKRPKARYAAPKVASVALFCRRFMSDALLDRLFGRYMGVPHKIDIG